MKILGLFISPRVYVVTSWKEDWADDEVTYLGRTSTSEKRFRCWTARQEEDLAMSVDYESETVGRIR